MAANYRQGAKIRQLDKYLTLAPRHPNRIGFFRENPNGCSRRRIASPVRRRVIQKTETFQGDQGYVQAKLLVRFDQQFSSRGVLVRGVSGGYRAARLGVAIDSWMRHEVRSDNEGAGAPGYGGEGGVQAGH